jgi:DnaJ-like protein
VDRAIAYAVLDISAEATPEEVRAAYRRRAFATHPDRGGGDAAAFHAVSDAYRSLSDPALHRAQEHGPASEPDTSTHVPPTDAAKVLFEYLSDLASEMILNGATPEMVVSFLALEGCPESVARALERDLRDRVEPAPSNPPAAAASVEAPAAAPPVVPSVASRPVSSFPRWLAVTVPAATVAACILGASLVARPARSPAKSAEVAPPAAVAVAPIPPSAPAPARPPRSAPARTSAQQAPRPPTRARETASPRAASAEIDADRDALEADQRRFAAEAAELEAESRRIDAEEAALASKSDVERYAALIPRKAAYNARVELARRKEKALQRRVRDLNAQITAYNDRVRSGR